MSNKIKMITHFKLSSMTLKIITLFNGENIHDQSAHAPVFQAMQEKLMPLIMTTIQEVDKILDALATITEIESVEITNPVNGNGFLYTFDRESNS